MRNFPCPSSYAHLSQVSASLIIVQGEDPLGADPVRGLSISFCGRAFLCANEKGINTEVLGHGKNGRAIDILCNFITTIQISSS